MPDKVYKWRKHSSGNGEGEIKNDFTEVIKDSKLEEELNNKFSPQVHEILFVDYNPTCVWTGTKWY